MDARKRSEVTLSIAIEWQPPTMLASPQSHGPLPLIIVPERHVDARGWFSETFNQQRLYNLGITSRFVQDNQSLSKRKGTARGFHFQSPPAAQAKLINVARGRILDIVVDIRRGSPSYGMYVSAELSAENGQQVYVPPGFAHGFVSLDDDVLVSYKVSAYYSPVHDGGLRWDDPVIAFPWPFERTEMILSEKDRRLPYLINFESPFPYEGNPLTELRVCSVCEPTDSCIPIMVTGEVDFIGSALARRADSR